MKMEEFFRALETYVASRMLNLGDGESVLSLLYEAYGDINPMYDDQIKSGTSSPPGTGSDFSFISKIFHTEFVTPGFACRRTGGFVYSKKQSSLDDLTSQAPA